MTCTDIIENLGGIVAKFLCAYIFGCMVSFIVLFVALLVDVEAIWDSSWTHIFWVIPLVWGVLGLFWYKQMLEIGRKIVMEFWGIEE
jgi:hypothetical protein